MSKRYEFCAPWATSGCLHSTWLNALVPSLHETIFWVCRFAFLLSFSFAGNRRHAIICIEVICFSFLSNFIEKTEKKNVFFFQKNICFFKMSRQLSLFRICAYVSLWNLASKPADAHRTTAKPIERLSNPVEPRRTPSNVYRTSIEPHRTCIEPHWRCLQLLLNFCSNDCGGR